MTALAPLLAWCAFGALIGAAYFATLELNVRLYTSARPGWAAVATHGARFLIAVVCFAAVARGAGAPALLAAFAGFLTVRSAAVYSASSRLEDVV